MSKIALEPNDSGAGTFSIVSPDSNINRTLNLPDESGTLLNTDSNGNVRVNGINYKDDPDTNISFDDNLIKFSTEGSEAAEINADGQLLIGRTSNQGLSGRLALTRKLAVVGGQGGTMVLDCAGISGSFSEIRLNFSMGGSSSAIVELQIAAFSRKELDFLAMQYSSQAPNVLRNTSNRVSASLTGSSVSDFEVTVTGGFTHPVVFVKVVAGRGTPSFSVEPTLTFD